MTGGTNCPAAYEAEDLLREVAVADALRAISAAHREILNETILRGRTVNEAAAAMGLPVGTVKSRVYYALRLVLAERAAAEPGCGAGLSSWFRALPRSGAPDESGRHWAGPPERRPSRIRRSMRSCLKPSPVATASHQITGWLPTPSASGSRTVKCP